MKYSSIFSKFKKQHILVIGDLILDHYVWGTVERISPEAPVPIVDVKKENYTMGGATNVAANIAALGGKATVVGVRGTDVHGDILEGLLAERRIDTSGIFQGRRPATVKTRVIAHNQQVVRFDREKRRRLDEHLLERLIAFLESRHNTLDVVSEIAQLLNRSGHKKAAKRKQVAAQGLRGADLSRNPVFSIRSGYRIKARYDDKMQFINRL
jgi:rfaE bifunctional protein kinase chain/domain